MLGNLRLSLHLLGAALVWTTPAPAQDPARAQTGARASAEEAAARPTAPVIVDGVTLFSVRGISAFPAEQRAREIADRIAALGADRTVPVEALTVQETPLRSVIAAGNHRVLSVVDADAELEGLTRQVLADVSRTRVADAVRAFRRDREAAVLWPAVGRAVLATLAFVLFLALGRRVVRRLHALMEGRYRSRVRDVQFRTIEIVRGDNVWRALHGAVGGLVTLIALVAGYAYVDYVLLLFPWTRAFANGLSGMLLRPLATLGTGFLAFIPDLVFLVILALVTRYAGKLVGLLFRGIKNGTITLAGFEPDWATPTERIVRLGLIVFALVIAYPYIPGSGSEAFKGIGLVLGLMFSLGSPSVIGNAIAGLSLAFRRAFKVGDRVRIGEHIGEVREVGLLTTYLRSLKNEEIVVPNSLILNSEVVNFSTLARGPGLILHTNVSIGYATPWRQVEAMLLESARRTPGLPSKPEPFVLQRALGVFAVDYEINVYCDNPRGILSLYSALHRNILDVFNEYGVQIMTPAYEGDPERAKVVTREQWFSSPAPSADPERPVVDALATMPAMSTDATLTRAGPGVS